MSKSIVLLLFIPLAACIAEKQPSKDDLDKQFREKLTVFYMSQDFSKIRMFEIHDKIAEIAYSVYFNHNESLNEFAKKTFEKLPKTTQIDDSLSEEPFSLSIPELFDVLSRLAEESPDKSREAIIKEVLIKTQNGHMFINNYDVVSASKMFMNMAIHQGQPDHDMIIKRGTLTSYVRDAFYRLNDDFLHPKIAVRSIGGELFIIELDWNDMGFYFPNKIEWHRPRP
jgi:hypothetical protein